MTLPGFTRVCVAGCTLHVFVEIIRKSIIYNDILYVAKAVLSRHIEGKSALVSIRLLQSTYHGCLIIFCQLSTKAYSEEVP